MFNFDNISGLKIYKKFKQKEKIPDNNLPLGKLITLRKIHVKCEYKW